MSSSTDKSIIRLMKQLSLKEHADHIQPELAGKVEIEPYLLKSASGWQVEFKIGLEKKYILQDIGLFVRNIMSVSWYEYGKNLAFYHDKSAFTKESRKLVDFLEDCVDKELEHQRGTMPYSGSSWEYSVAISGLKRSIFLTPGRMAEFAKAMAGRDCLIASGSQKGYVVSFLDQDPVLMISLEEDYTGGCRLMLPDIEVFRSRKKMTVWQGNTVYNCSPEYIEHMGDLCSLAETVKYAGYYIHEDDLRSFCATVLPAIDGYAVVKKPDFIKEYMPASCQILFYLDLVEGDVELQAFGQYGNARYFITDPLESKEMFRNIAQEERAFETAVGYFPHIDREKGVFTILGAEDDLLYRFLSLGIYQLQQVGEVYLTDSLRKLQILNVPRFMIGVALNAGLLDITIDSGRLTTGELADLLDSYRKQKKFYRLKDGSFLELSDPSLEAVAELTEGLEVTEEQLKKGHITVPEYRSFYLDQILKESKDHVIVTRDQNFQVFMGKMEALEIAEPTVPEGLRTELKPYQVFGYGWLSTLDQLGFGGILADDMGLGKTVQAIAFLLGRKAEGNMDSGRHFAMIVCPASLVYNWENEIQRFTGDLTAEAIVGNGELRMERIQHSKADIFLTSYELLKRDIDQYADMNFEYLILDEAQNIKNHLTQNAKAVKSITAKRRFALTGTPIENSLGELWSIFDFLMPGILNSYQRFREQYELPITVQHDENAALRLRKLVKPFILRRMKREVLKELPDKIEEVVYSKMEEDQKILYNASVQRVLDSVGDQSVSDYHTGKIEILAELTKLRQLCCDPGIVYDNYSGSAAKVDTCMELLTAAVESGNKTLVFSQFTTMLEVIRKRLDEDKIDYYVLTGSTSKEKRQELVEAFNSDDVPVFLISLKAGGTGLNLTAASIVIHVDPWWNQAAQNQATDRAHRIGQEQVVTVYKLIMKDTIEERILKLQEEKAGLSEEIIAEGSMTDAIGTKEQFMELLRIAVED